jgi:hypothetical protein
LTTRRRRRHNGAVRRRLIVLLFCLAAWATFAQVVPPAADAATRAVAPVLSETAADVPGGTSGSDSRWNAGYRANVSATESLWKSSVVHADLAAARSGRVLATAYTVDRREPPARHRPPHLLHVPLLI